MKKLICIALSVFALSQFTACGSESAPAQSGVAELGTITTANTISLNGSSAEVSGSGMAVNGNVVSISAPGSYTVSGKLSDGQIIVDVPGEGAELKLILNNADITNLSGHAIHIKNGKDLELRLAEGSVNSLTSGTPVMTSDGNSSGAALYAEDDMEIDGDGKAVLNVKGYINNGIACKNDLDIKAGQINITAVNNGLRGSDSVEIKGGSITIDAGNDGVKSTTADKEGKGYISIEAGSLSVTAGGDGISADTELSITGGSVEVRTTGNPETESCKGIKANKALSVSGGDVKVYAEDHAMQCNGDINISGGELELGSNLSKAIKVDGKLDISGGAVNMDSQEDAVDSIGDVSITGGFVYISTMHDGIQAGEANSGKGNISVTGGDVLIDAYKLGFNPRGELSVSGGTVLAISGTDKTIPGDGFSQYSWNGVKGDEVSLEGSGVSAKLHSMYGYKSVLVSSIGGPYTITGGGTSVMAD